MEIGRISILFETLLHLQQWNCCFKGWTDFNSSHCLKFCITLIKTYKITTTSKYLILWYKIYIAGQDRIILLPFSYHRLRMQYHLYLSGARSNPDNCVLLLPLYFQIDIYLTNNLFVSEWWQEDWGKYYLGWGKKEICDGIFLFVMHLMVGIDFLLEEIPFLLSWDQINNNWYTVHLQCTQSIWKLKI